MQSINLCFSIIFLVSPDIALRIYSDDEETVAAAIIPLKIIAIGHLIDSV